MLLVHIENKILEVEEKITDGDLIGARNKLEFDVKDKPHKWLANDFPVETPLQLSKQDVINLVDSAISRLGV